MGWSDPTKIVVRGASFKVLASAKPKKR
jgi:hypothetical protein